MMIRGYRSFNEFFTDENRQIADCLRRLDSYGIIATNGRFRRRKVIYSLTAKGIDPRRCLKW
jgi:DNA-binding PadR family transcriptional regulator